MIYCPRLISSVKNFGFGRDGEHDLYHCSLFSSYFSEFVCVAYCSFCTKPPHIWVPLGNNMSCQAVFQTPLGDTHLPRVGSVRDWYGCSSFVLYLCNLLTRMLGNIRLFLGGGGFLNSPEDVLVNSHYSVFCSGKSG